MKLNSQMKRPGAMLAGIFSLALMSVVLLCGAGSVPVENFAPQGTMQSDLNAGGHNLTNAGTVSATNLIVSGSFTAANLGTAATNAASAFAPASGSTNYAAANGPFPWANVTGAPSIQAPITVTTTGSGAATFSGNTLNIPTPVAGGVTSFDSRTGAVTLQASDLAISGASLTALPAGTSLYPTFNQSTTGTATYALNVPWSGVSGAPSTFAPSGGAGGDLGGTYPNPSVLNALHLTNFPSATVMGLGSAATNAASAFAPASGSANYAPATGSANYLAPIGNGSSLTNIHSYQTMSFSGTTTSTLTLQGRTTWDYVTMSAGSGAYTGTIVIPSLGAQAGDEVKMVVALPASLNPTLVVIDGASTGTLTTMVQTLANSGTTTLEFPFNGSNFVHAPKDALLTRNLGAGVQAATGTTTNGNNGLIVADTRGNIPLDPHTANLDGCAFIFEGDSITYGYMLSSPSTQCFGYLFSQLPFALNHGTFYNDGVRQATINYGQQAVVGNWTGATTTITLTSTPGVPLGPMSVTGTNIPYATTGTLSGSTLTLSQPTTGSGTSVAITLGGNDITDRYVSQVKPHRPTANGGDGGPRAYLFVLIGTNDITDALTSAQIITALNSYVTTAQADGFTVVLGTILSRGLVTWTPANDATRQTVNAAIRSGERVTTGGTSTVVPSNMVADYAALLSNPYGAFFNSDFLHPTAAGHIIMANYLNALMLAGGDLRSRTPSMTDDPIGFGTPAFGNDPEGVAYAATFSKSTLVYNPYTVGTTNITAYRVGNNSGVDQFDLGWTGTLTGGIPASSDFINTTGSVTLSFAQNQSVKMQMSSAGNILVGTGTLTDGGNGKLQVASGNATIETAGYDWRHYFTTLAASGTVNPGFNTLTGTTASQTGTLTSPVAGLETVIENYSSQSWTITSLTGAQIVPVGGSSTGTTTTLASHTAVEFWSDGTNWYAK